MGSERHHVDDGGFEGADAERCFKPSPLVGWNDSADSQWLEAFEYRGESATFG